MILPFEPDHLFCIDVQEAQKAEMPELHAAAPTLGGKGPCWTIIHGEQVICCAGIIEINPSRSAVWAVLSGSMGARGFVYLDRVLRRLILKENTVRRMETTAPANFEQARRWLELLGFQHEGLMRAFTEDGRDHHLYARVRR